MLYLYGPFRQETNVSVIIIVYSSIQENHVLLTDILVVIELSLVLNSQ